MYYEFTGIITKRERVKIPDEIAKDIPKKAKSMEVNDIVSNTIYSDRYYDKIIPQAVAEFLIDVHFKRYHPGRSPFSDQMEIDDTIVYVLGTYGADRMDINMFAYKKQERD